MRYFPLVFGVLMFISGAACADDIPDIDVGPNCEAYARHAPGDFARVKAYCISTNDRARAELGGPWAKADGLMRSKCSVVHQSHPFPYSVILSCVIGMEKDAKRQKHG